MYYPTPQAGMGKTTPTYRDQLRTRPEPYDDQYRRALRRHRQEAYDELREEVEELTMAMGAANDPDVWKPFLVSLAVVQQERIRDLEQRVETLETG